MPTMIGIVIKAVLGAIFGSLLARFFPPATAADQKADDLTVSLQISEAENKAAADAPTDQSSLVNALKKHMVSFLFATMFLSSCAQNVGSACPQVRPWTDLQEDEIAANFATLPAGSPLIAVGSEWVSLRQQSKACAEVLDGG